MEKDKVLVNGKYVYFDPEDYIIVPHSILVLHKKTIYNKKGERNKLNFKSSGMRSIIYTNFKIIDFADFLQDIGTVDDMDDFLKEISRWRDSGFIVKFITNQSSGKDVNYCLFSDCHHPRGDEMRIYFQRIAYESRFAKPFKKQDTEPKSPSYGFDFNTTKSPSPSTFDSSALDNGEYDFQEDLKNIRLEKIDKEIGIFRMLSTLRDLKKSLLASYHINKKSKNFDQALNDRLYSEIGDVMSRIREVKRRMNWYEKSVDSE